MRTTYLATLLAPALVAACAALSEPEGPQTKEVVVAATAGNELLRFNAGQPRRILSRVTLKGLIAGDSLVGIDYRVARGLLYGLGTSGRLYLIDPALGSAKPVGDAPPVALGVGQVGLDFNPAVDRIRVVTSGRLNLRLHPDTGAVVDADPNAPGTQFDGPLAYADGDANAGRMPAIAAAAYTYNKQDEKLTTNFAIDAALGVLVVQGSREATTPVVSPNSGRLSTVGPLGVERFERASFDIADLTNAAWLAAGTATGATRWYRVDLQSGKARLVGTITTSEPITGVAIEP